MTVPKCCREKLGLKTGTVLDFEVIEGVLVAKKVQPEDVFHKWRGQGWLPEEASVDQYLKQVRG